MNITVPNWFYVLFAVHMVVCIVANLTIVYWRICDAAAKALIASKAITYAVTIMPRADEDESK